jgi:membrane associated rhomboid family serine protease
MARHPLTISLIPVLVILAVYLVELRVGVDAAVAWGGISRAGVLAGRWWTPLTSIFLHVSLVHAALNGAALVVFGRALAARLGAGRYLGFFLACGLAGALGYVLLHFDSREPAVGASDVVFGLWGGYARSVGLEAGTRPLASRFLAVQTAGAVAANLALIAALKLAAGTWAAWAGHLGGYLAGLLLIGALLQRPGAS